MDNDHTCVCADRHVAYHWFAIAANRQMAKAREVPEGFQNVVELIVEKLDAMVDAPMGKAAPKFYNYIGTIFIFILVSNISGLLGLRPPQRTTA